MCVGGGVCGRVWIGSERYREVCVGGVKRVSVGNVKCAEEEEVGGDKRMEAEFDHRANKKGG